MKNQSVIPREVQNVLRRLEEAGYEAWCVGGCVRDLLLGVPPMDWDVTTSAQPEEVMDLFPRRTIPTGLKHGTVSVRSGGQMVEVTTYRLDGAYEDHRRPSSVAFTDNLEEDLRRRDFTVNAMAFSLREELRDPLGGRRDLRDGILRCVGNPEERFQEDALRLMRAVRFASVLGFTVEPETAAAVHSCRELLNDIAVERIQKELRRLLWGKAAAAVLREYADVIGVFWPEILEMRGFEQRNPHHCYDVWEHTLHVMEALPALMSRGGVREEADREALCCAALLHDIGKPRTFTTDDSGVGHFYGHGQVSRGMADDMIRRLHCANVFRTRVDALVDWHDREIARTVKSVGRALGKLGLTDFRLLILLKRADNLGQDPAFRFRQQELDEVEAVLKTVLSRREALTVKNLAVNGHDLKSMGFKGPAIGSALEDLLYRVMDGELPNERKALLRAARRRRKRQKEKAARRRAAREQAEQAAKAAEAAGEPVGAEAPAESVGAKALAEAVSAEPPTE